jgi:hypothetical protein
LIKEIVDGNYDDDKIEKAEDIFIYEEAYARKLQKFEEQFGEKIGTKEYAGLYCNMVILKIICLFILFAQIFSTKLILGQVFKNGTKQLILFGPV